jgi:hypothetical protein
VDLSAGLDDVEKRKFLTLPGLELRLLGRPARSQSLYRVSYPVSCKVSEGLYQLLLKRLNEPACSSHGRNMQLIQTFSLGYQDEGGGGRGSVVG